MSETIAFDIDDVLLDTAPAILDHYRETYGVHVPTERFYDRDLSIWGVDDYNLATERVGKFLNSPEFALYPPRTEAVRGIRDIAKVHRLVAVTGRPSSLQDLTERWLDCHFGGVFEDVRLTNHFNDNHVTKGEVCHELGADWLVDDHIVHLRTLGEYGIRGVLFGNLPWGRGHELPENIHQAATWSQLKRTLGL